MNNQRFSLPGCKNRGIGKLEFEESVRTRARRARICFFSDKISLTIPFLEQHTVIQRFQALRQISMRVLRNSFKKLKLKLYIYIGYKNVFAA